MRPLLLFGVLYVFFTKVAHVNTRPPDRGGRPLLRRAAARLDRAVHVLQRSDDGAVRSVVDNENLVRKIQFPRMVIPLSVVLLACSTCAEPGRGVDLRADRRRAPDAQLARAAADRRDAGRARTGMAMLLSALFVYFRDIQPIWEVVCQILFYSSPVIIPVGEAPHIAEDL
jgi:ABC-2 type transport system permease protein